MFSRSLQLREYSQLLPVAASFEFARRIPILFHYIPRCFILYCAVSCSRFISMGVIAVNMQSASLDVVRNAFAIQMQLRRCTCMYFRLLCSKFVASIHTGSPYISRARITPLYIVAIALYIIPHVNFTALISCVLVLRFSLLRKLCVHGT